MLAALLISVAVTQNGSPPVVPEAFDLDLVARQAIEAEWLTDDERGELRVFHGVWDDRDLTTPTRRAMVALNAWRHRDPVFSDPSVPAELRADARLLAGDFRQAIALVENVDSVRAARIRAEAHEGLGEFDAVVEVLAPALGRRRDGATEDAATLTELVRALAVAARVEGQPARDYQRMLGTLARAHQQIDRLYWPALLVEGQLLLDKHDRIKATQALHEAMGLQPRCADGWYALGRIALTRFEFDAARLAVAALRRIDAAHPLADLLYAESRLVQNDPSEALYVLTGLIDREPRLRPAHALAAAGHALLYDQEGMQAALQRYDELSPGSGEAYHAAGRFLSMFRQYDEAAVLFQEAVRRQPAWSAPRLELGLMEMQTGRDDRALSVLREVIEIDPFNKRAANSLFLLEELAEYAEIETDHFVIRYRPGPDEVLAELMPEPLERIHETVASRFGWTPPGKTIIELMPDHKRFAVRITGMPHIHTIAACTGPIIAMEIPRSGSPALHQGTFDWQRVLQHEYTHTITLDQTRYRIPHWLTEAAAVSMEHAPRDYEDCLMLARAYHEGTLFGLDEIKWAFVRPRRPGDRGKAYAQGHWMVEFMNELFGPAALVDLLARYFAGEREEDAMPHALGVTREQFFDTFLVWAGQQVETWGLSPRPTLEELTDELRLEDPDLALMMAASRQARLEAIVRTMAERIGRPAGPDDRPFSGDDWPSLMRPPVEVDDEQLARWREQYPDHPDLLREELRRAIDATGAPDETLIQRLERYAELCPVDLFPHRRLAQIHLAGDDRAKAIPHLEAIDAREEKSSVYAWQLARLYRESGDLDRALARSERAVTIDPYNADHRELVASIAVQAGRLDLAHRHVRALTLLEPDRPQHTKRLERIETLMKGGG